MQRLLAQGGFAALAVPVFLLLAATDRRHGGGDILISSSLFSAGGLWVGCAPPCTWEDGEQVMSLLLSASPEGAFRRLMVLGVFRRHIALPKSGFGVRQVPWAALSQLLAVSGAQH